MEKLSRHGCREEAWGSYLGTGVERRQAEVIGTGVERKHGEVI